MKKIISILFAMLFCFSFASVAFAAEKPDIIIDGYKISISDEYSSVATVKLIDETGHITTEEYPGVRAVIKVKTTDTITCNEYECPSKNGKCSIVWELPVNAERVEEPEKKAIEKVQVEAPAPEVQPEPVVEPNTEPVAEPVTTPATPEEPAQDKISEAEEPVIEIQEPVTVSSTPTDIEPVVEPVAKTEPTPTDPEPVVEVKEPETVAASEIKELPEQLKLRIPEITLPDINIPEINIPDVEIPDIEIPNINKQKDVIKEEEITVTDNNEEPVIEALTPVTVSSAEPIPFTGSAKAGIAVFGVVAVAAAAAFICTKKKDASTDASED